MAVRIGVSNGLYIWVTKTLLGTGRWEGCRMCSCIR